MKNLVLFFRDYRSRFVSIGCLLLVALSLPEVVHGEDEHGRMVGNFRYRFFNLTESEAAAKGLPMHYAELFNNGWMGDDNQWINWSAYQVQRPNQMLELPSHVTYNGRTYPVIGINANPGAGYCRNVDRWYGIILPDSLVYLCDSAFTGCRSIKKVVLPTTLRTIGVNAFADCNIDSVYIPANVREIGIYYCKNAFRSSALKSFIVSPDNETYDSRDGCNALIETATNTLLLAYPCTSPTIPESVTALGIYAFCYDAVSSISLPSRITSIPDYCFCYSDVEDIPNLSSLPIESIGRSAFYKTQLISIQLPSTLKTIEGSAFSFCSRLKDIVIPKSVTEIGPCFGYCDSLMSIKVEPGNAVYDSRDNCNAVIMTQNNTLVAGCAWSTIPASVTTIGWSAFLGNKPKCLIDAEGTLTIPGNVTDIQGYAFSLGRIVPTFDIDYNTLHIPPTVRVIDSYAFNDNNYENLIIDRSDESQEFGRWAFNSQTLRKAVIASDVIPSRILGLKSRFFLTVVVDQSVSEIADSAFSGIYRVSNYYFYHRYGIRIAFDKLSDAVNGSPLIWNPSGSRSGYHDGYGEVMFVIPEPNWWRLDPNTQMSGRGYEVRARGDVNGDNSVDGSDLNEIINIILSRTDSSIYSSTDYDNASDIMADVDFDDNITGSDVNELIKMLLGKK